MREEETTVASRGIGRPDYSPEVTPNQGVIGANQTQWSSYTFLTVPAGSFSGWIDYTVPSGYSLYLTTAIIGCYRSGVQRYQLQIVEGLVTRSLGLFTYDICKESSWGRPSKISAGGYIYATIYNPDSVLNSYTLTLIGTLERESAS